MITIADGVEFDTIAREWRCKWSDDADKASLVEAQKLLESVIGSVKAVDGVKSVQRVVCGGCLDFKVGERKKSNFIITLILTSKVCMKFIAQLPKNYKHIEFHYLFHR